MSDLGYPEYDLARDMYYRVVHVGWNTRAYARMYAPKDYVPTVEQLAAKASRDMLILANEEFLSKAIQPVMRKRRFKVIGWLLGLRKSRPSRS